MLKNYYGIYVAKIVLIQINGKQNLKSLQLFNLVLSS